MCVGGRTRIMMEEVMGRYCRPYPRQRKVEVAVSEMRKIFLRVPRSLTSVCQLEKGA
jgi:hypothetical protein